MPLSPIAAQSEASRRNAVHHGLRGIAIEVTPDEQDFLADTIASLECRWKPVDAVEHNLVQALALMELKLVRLDTIEMQLLSAAIAEPDGKRLPSLNTLLRYRNRILKERWEAEHRLRAAIAQRCTNEAEGKALTKGRDDVERRDTSTFLLDTLDQTRAGQPLNREQRRRLAAVQRKAA